MPAVSLTPWRRSIVILTVMLGLSPGWTVLAENSPKPASELLESSVWIAILECDTRRSATEPMGVPIIDTCLVLGSGSGTIIDPKGLVLTNAHVAFGGDLSSMSEPYWMAVGLTVNDRDLPQLAYLARPVAWDKTLDLSIIAPAYGLDGKPIKPDRVHLPPIAIGDESQEVDLEDRIRLIGYPGVGGETVSLFVGQVTGFSPDPANPELSPVGWIETSASAGPGVSGGTAVNDAGEFIGVPTQGLGGVVICPEDQSEESCATTGEKIQQVRPIPAGLSELNRRADANNQRAVIGSDTPTGTSGPGVIGKGVTPTASKTTASGADPAGKPGAQTPVPDQPVEDGVLIRGTLVSADTDDPIDGGYVIVLRPGITVTKFAQAKGDPEMVESFGESNGRGQFQLEDRIERDQEYGVVILADGFDAVAQDDVLLATADDPDTVDVGKIELPESR